jgi:hypothetical protein
MRRSGEEEQTTTAAADGIVERAMRAKGHKRMLARLRAAKACDFALFELVVMEASGWRRTRSRRVLGLALNVAKSELTVAQSTLQQLSRFVPMLIGNYMNKVRLVYYATTRQLPDQWLIDPSHPQALLPPATAPDSPQFVCLIEYMALRAAPQNHNIMAMYAQIAVVVGDVEPIEACCAHCRSATNGRHRCGGCRAEHYCSRACQAAHWPMHRGDCLERRHTTMMAASLKTMEASHEEGEEEAAAATCADDVR